MNVTVIITAWRRFRPFPQLIHDWLAEPEVTEVILWDNSEGNMPEELVNVLAELAATEPRFWFIRSSRNYGSSARYALSSLAKNEVLLFADDDVQPHPGLTADLLEHYADDRMIGIKGRIFRGAYTRQTEVRGERMARGASPIEVDMLVGHIMLTHRDWLMPYNFSDAAWYCCELELQGRINQDIREGLREGPFSMWVIPSDKHHDLPEQTDSNALYRQADANAEKAEVFERLFRGRCIMDRKEAA